jgi:TfoX/Sxy family transcriptional regulator of competence genes
VLIERFEKLVPGDAAVERRKMFGCACAFVGGNMFVGVHEDRLILRLDEARRTQLLEQGLVEPFSPMGRTMREYVAVETAAQRPAKELAALAREAFAFASRLPAKVKRKTKRAAPIASAPRSKRRSAAPT